MTFLKCSLCSAHCLSKKKDNKKQFFLCPIADRAMMFIALEQTYISLLFPTPYHARWMRKCWFMLCSCDYVVHQCLALDVQSHPEEKKCCNIAKKKKNSRCALVRHFAWECHHVTRNLNDNYSLRSCFRWLRKRNCWWQNVGNETRVLIRNYLLSP